MGKSFCDYFIDGVKAVICKKQVVGFFFFAYYVVFHDGEALNASERFYAFSILKYRA